jgi:TPR repeat protein
MLRPARPRFLALVLTALAAGSALAGARTWSDHWKAALAAGKAEDYAAGLRHLKRCIQISRAEPRRLKRQLTSYLAFHGMAELAGKPALAGKALARARSVVVGAKGEGHPIVAKLDALRDRPAPGAANPVLVDPFELAMAHLEAGDAAALADLVELGEGGHGVAARVAAVAYFRGELVPPDPVLASRLLRLAALAEDAPALRTLALMTAEGQLATRSEPRARAMMQRAAELGDGPAAYLYAQFLAEGLGGPRDEAGSALWFARARELGRRSAPLVEGAVPGAGQVD